MIKHVFLLAFGVVSVSQLGFGAACSSTSLATYVGLGSTGCTYNGFTLSNFQLLPPTGSATKIDEMFVLITPTGGIYNPGITTSVSQTATDPNSVESIFTYKISGGMFVGTSGTLGASTMTAGGSITGIENYCGGGTFDVSLNCSTAITGSILTLNGTQQSDSTSFAKSSFLSVADDIVIDGTGGTATGATFATSFVSVPEPVSISLTFLGIAFAAAHRKRIIKANLTEK